MGIAMTVVAATTAKALKMTAPTAQNVSGTVMNLKTTTKLAVTMKLPQPTANRIATTKRRDR
jgi:hypothetical protein